MFTLYNARFGQVWPTGEAWQGAGGIWFGRFITADHGTSVNLELDAINML